MVQAGIHSDLHDVEWVPGLAVRLRSTVLARDDRRLSRDRIMLTGIAHLEMRVRDLAACRTLYGEQLGLKELAHGAGRHGDRVSMFATGESVLELHEDADAVTSLLPSGERKDPRDVPGSVGHFAFYTADNHEAFKVLKKSLGGTPLTTPDGPSVQPMDHAYMQRSLLQFDDPDGYVIQVTDLIDPRERLQGRLDEKRSRAAAAHLCQGYGGQGGRGLGKALTTCRSSAAMSVPKEISLARSWASKN